MTRTTVTRTIHAPADVVFRAVSDVANLPSTVPCIVSTELLSETTSGVGTRFRETRDMNGKHHTTDLDVTEYVENERVRMVADSHGTIWDTVFTVRPSGGGTNLEIAMDARAHMLVPRLLNPFMKGLFKKGLDKHIDAVKAYCEQASG
jgi:ribosome-associated toxin RatA of RatAB toxin-antitoxin module